MAETQRVSVMRQAPERRISTTIAAFMVIAAVCFDGVQVLITAIPIIGQLGSMFVDIFATCLFWIWFMLQGVPFASGRKAGLKIATAFGTSLIELIPFIDALPAITAGVVIIIIASWAEDAPKEIASRQGTVLARFARMKSRQGGASSPEEE